MKSIRYLLLILLMICILRDIQAQKVFREGYIVKNSGETLTGLVEFSSKQGIPDPCRFRRFEIARTVEYSPSDIKAFGYINGNRYESLSLKNTKNFFEVLVSGAIKLYLKGSQYYVEKDISGPVELKNGPVTISTPEGTKQFREAIELLAYLTGRKAGTIPKNFNIKTGIVPLITNYNEQACENYYVYRRTYNEKQLTQLAWKSGVSRNRFGILTGIKLYSINMKINPLMYGVSSDDYVPLPGKETGFTAGLSYERLLFRKTDRIAIRLNLLISDQSFYSYSERSGTGGSLIRDDANFGFKGIKVPVLVQYSFTGGRAVPYLNAGVAYQLFLNTDYHHTYEVENLVHEIYTYEDQNMTFRKGELTGAGGLGVRVRIFNNININLYLMAEYGKGIFVNELPENVNHNAKKPYVQNTLQETLLLGITF